jgi:hypothetical protein
MHGAPSTYSSCSFYPHMPRHSSCSKNSCFYYSYAPPATHALTLMHAPSTHACSSYFLLLMLSCILLLILVLSLSTSALNHAPPTHMMMLLLML